MAAGATAPRRFGPPAPERQNRVLALVDAPIGDYVTELVNELKLVRAERRRHLRWKAIPHGERAQDAAEEAGSHGDHDHDDAIHDFLSFHQLAVLAWQDGVAGFVGVHQQSVLIQSVMVVLPPWLHRRLLANHWFANTLASLHPLSEWITTSWTSVY